MCTCVCACVYCRCMCECICAWMNIDVCMCVCLCSVHVCIHAYGLYIRTYCHAHVYWCIRSVLVRARCTVSTVSMVLR